MGLQPVLVEPGQQVTVMMDAQVVESVTDVRWVSVENRKCWFNDEVSVVQSSPGYSYRTCITECRMEVLQEKCGCTPFFYPFFSKYLLLK